MTELEKRRFLAEIGQRAVDYYLDTGLCVFCDADDCAGRPHDECNVGELAGVEVTPERIARKARERALVEEHARRWGPRNDSS